MNKAAVIVGILVLALSLQGRNRTVTVKAENYGLNISGYSKEKLTDIANNNVTVVKRVNFSPSVELSSAHK